MSYPAKKTTLLHELESAIKRKTHEKNRHRDMANKQLQYSIEKKKAGQNQSRERLASNYKHGKVQKHYEIDNKPISLFNNATNDKQSGFLTEQFKESINNHHRQPPNKPKKTNNRKLDKLVSLINYAISSAQKIVKYMNTDSFEGQFAVKLFRSDKENLVNQLKNLTVEDILKENKIEKQDHVLEPNHPQDKNSEKLQVIIDLQNQNSKFKAKIATLEKEMQLYAADKDMFQIPQGKPKELDRYKETLDYLVGVSNSKRIFQVLEKETKFQLIALKSSGNTRKIMEVEAILKSLRMERVTILKDITFSASSTQKPTFSQQEQSWKIAQLIRKRIKPFVSQNLTTMTQVLEEYLQMTESVTKDPVNSAASSAQNRFGRSSSVRGSGLRDNSGTSKECLRKELHELRDKFQQIEGKAKVYQQNELLRINIDKIYQQLIRLVHKFTSDQQLGEDEQFESLLKRIEEHLNQSTASPKAEEIDLIKLQQKIEQQCKNNVSLKKINVNLMEENQQLQQKLGEEIQLSSQLQSQINSLKERLVSTNCKQQLQSQALKEQIVGKSKRVEQLQKEVQELHWKISQMTDSTKNGETGPIKTQSGELQSRIIGLQSQVAYLQNENQKLTQYKGLLEDNYRELDSNMLKEIDTREEGIVKLKEENNSLVTELMNANEKINALYASQKTNQQQISSNYKKQLVQKDKQTERLKSELEAQIDQLQIKVQEMEQSEQDYAERLNHLTHKDEQSQSSLHQLNLELKNLNKALQEVQKQKQTILEKQKSKQKAQQEVLNQQFLKEQAQLKEEIRNLNERLDSLKVNSNSFRTQNKHLQAKQQILQKNIQQLGGQLQLEKANNAELLKEKQRIALELQLTQSQLKKQNQKFQTQDKRLQLETLQTRLESTQKEMKQLRNINAELTQNRLSLKQSLENAQEQVSKQKQQCSRLRDQYYLLEAQVQRLSGELLQKGEKITRLQQQNKKKQNKVSELAQQKARKSMNESSYCNLIKRILRTQIDSEQFEALEDFEQLLELGSQKVMEQRKRKRQQQSNQRKKVLSGLKTVAQNSKDDEHKDLEDHKVTLFTEQIASESQLQSEQGTKTAGETKHQQQDLNDLDGFNDYNEGSLNQSMVSEKASEKQQNLLIDDQNQQNEGKSFGQFKDYDENIDSSMVSNTEIHQQKEPIKEKTEQKPEVQKQSDMDQFNDYKSERLNASMLSNTEVQHQQNSKDQSKGGADFGQFDDVKFDKLNQSLMSNQENQQKKTGQSHQEAADFDQFGDYKSDKMSESMLSQNSIAEQVKAEKHQQSHEGLSQFEDIKSEQQDSSMFSQNEIADPKKEEEGKGIDQFNDYKSEKLNDSVFSNTNEQKKENQAGEGKDFDQFGDFNDKMNSSVMSQGQIQHKGLNSDLSAIDFTDGGPEQLGTSRLSQFLHGELSHQQSPVKSQEQLNGNKE